MVPQSDPVKLALTGTLPIILILAAVSAWLLSVWLLKNYHAAVLKSMRSGNGGLQHPITVSPKSFYTEPYDLTGNPLSPAGTSNSSAEILFKQVTSRPWQAVRNYVVAGLCYAGVMTLAFFISSKIEFLFIRFILVFLNYAWPVVLTIHLLLNSYHPVKKLALPGYFLVFLSVGFMEAALNPEANRTTILITFIPWVVYNLLPTILLFAFFNRQVRAVGPLVFTFMVLSITGIFFTISLAARNDQSLRKVVDIGYMVGLGSTGILIVLVISGVTVFGLLGWLTLGIIRKRYDHKKISDQSIMLDAVWLLFAVVHASFLTFSGVYWFLSGLIAYALFKWITYFSFSLPPGRATGKESPKLLFLRVFALGKRSENLFRKLTKHWRYVSSIQLIAGPDLINSTVEPHEFLDFISGKLTRRFIGSPQALEQRLAEMDIEPDLDRRFRVNDFFCQDNTWKMCLSRLVNKSNIVLMDLRGFSSDNNGCKFEVNELINLKPLENLVFIIDNTTKEDYLQQILQESWRNIKPASPNWLTTPAHLRLFRYSGAENEIERLLQFMCAAAYSMPVKNA